MKCTKNMLKQIIDHAGDLIEKLPKLENNRDNLLKIWNDLFRLNWEIHKHINKYNDLFWISIKDRINTLMDYIYKDLLNGGN